MEQLAASHSTGRGEWLAASPYLTTGDETMTVHDTTHVLERERRVDHLIRCHNCDFTSRSPHEDTAYRHAANNPGHRVRLVTWTTVAATISTRTPTSTQP